MLFESVVDKTISILVIETSQTSRSLCKRQLIQFDSSFHHWEMLSPIADRPQEARSLHGLSK